MTIVKDQFIVTAHKLHDDKAEWCIAWRERAIWQAKRWAEDGYTVTVRPVGEPILINN